MWNYVLERISSSLPKRLERVTLLVWYQQVLHGWRHIWGWVLPVRRGSYSCIPLMSTFVHGIAGLSQNEEEASQFFSWRNGP